MFLFINIKVKTRWKENERNLINLKEKKLKGKLKDSKI